MNIYNKFNISPLHAMISKLLNLSILFIYAVTLSFTGCSGEIIKGSNPGIKITNTKVSIWINLMPGGDPSFHLTGKVIVLNAEKEPINNIKLNKIILLRDSTEIFYFAPVVSFPNDEKNIIIYPGKEKDLSFQAPQHLKAAKSIYDAKVVNLLLNFTFDGKEFDYVIPDQQINKVY